MKWLVPILIVLSAKMVLAEEQLNPSEVVLCQNYPELVTTTYFWKEPEVEYPVEMAEVLLQLMEMDLGSKRNAIDFEFPSTWKGSEIESVIARFNEYRDSHFSRQAECLLEHYQSGDRLHYFSQKPKGSYAKGYALYRDERVVAVVITDGITI